MNIIDIKTHIFDNIQLPESVPMKKGKAKGWLGEYHWVSLPSDPDTTDPTNDAIAWCTEQLGKSGSRWFEKERQFYFKDEKDMTMFILRWS